MSEQVSGISESGLDKIVLEVIESADRINKILNQLQLLVDETNSYFLSNSGSIFRKKMAEQASYYQTMSQNILSYASDFVNLKTLYRNRTTELIDVLQSSSNNY